MSPREDFETNDVDAAADFEWARERGELTADLRGELDDWDYE